jgi:hypothetical protein
MKTLLCLVLAGGALASPVVGFSQSTAPTRAQVRADLVRLEEAGYHVGDGDATTYPAEIQAAEAKIAAQDGQQAADISAPDNQTADNSAQDSQGTAGNGVGGTTLSGTSAAGSSPRLPKPSSCVGPASYCNIFFGN